MPGYSSWNDDENEERDWDRSEADDATDEDANPDESTFPCPGCGRRIYEEADACPYCGEYLADSDRQPAGKPWWLWLGVILIIGTMLSGVIFAAIAGFLH